MHLCINNIQENGHEFEREWECARDQLQKGVMWGVRKRKGKEVWNNYVLIKIFN